MTSLAGLRLSDADQMTTLDGFPASLTRVGFITISACNILPDLSGLGQVETVEGDLVLEFLPALTSVDGMSALGHVGGMLKVVNCLSLTKTAVEDWASFITVGGTIWIDP